MAAEELCVPPWIVADDDGEQLLLLNAMVSPSTPMFLKNRETFYGLVEKLEPTAADSDRELSPSEVDLLDQLRQNGMILPAAFVENERNLIPIFGHFLLGRLVVEIDVEAGTDLIYERLKELFGNFAAANRPPAGVVFRIVNITPSTSWADLASLATKVRDDLAKAAKAAEQTGVQTIWECPLHNDMLSGAGDFLDAFCRSKAIVRLDLIHTEEDLQRVCAASAAISQEGFDCIAEVYTAFEDSFISDVETLFRKGRCSALRVLPHFGSETGSYTIEHTRSVVNRGIIAFGELTRTLGVALNRSQPWGTILTSALVPIQGTLGWSKKQSTVYLNARGEWSRSSHHNSAGFLESLDSLFPVGDRFAASTWFDTRLTSNSFFPGAPDCPTCGFAGFCDKYWTPLVDVLRRGEVTTIAEEVARYECEIRKVVLSSLLDTLRAELGAASPALMRDKTTRAKFDKSTGDLMLESF